MVSSPQSVVLSYSNPRTLTQLCPFDKGSLSKGDRTGYKEGAKMRLNPQFGNYQSPATCACMCFLRTTPQEKKRSCHPGSRLGLARENGGQLLKEGVLPNLVRASVATCVPLLPGASSRPQTGRGCDAQACRPSTAWPQVDQMADHRPPAAPAPSQVCTVGAEQRSPLRTLKWHKERSSWSLCVRCLGGRGRQPWSGVRALVPGGRSCQQQPGGKDARFGGPSVLLVRTVAATGLPQIVKYKRLAACRPFANKPSQQGIQRSPKSVSSPKVVTRGLFISFLLDTCSIKGRLARPRGEAMQAAFKMQRSADFSYGIIQMELLFHFMIELGNVLMVQKEPRLCPCFP